MTYENNQYSIENHYQNATKNEKKNVQIFENSWVFKGIFEKLVFFQNY